MAYGAAESLADTPRLADPEESDAASRPPASPTGAATEGVRASDTNRLIGDDGLLATEALAVKPLTAAGGRRTRGLNREMLDTSPGAVFRILACKAKEAGSWYVELSARLIKPTQTCHACGRQEKNALSVREHVCPCGVHCGRDENAARVLVHWAVIGNAPSSERARCGERSAGHDPTIATTLGSEKQESPARPASRLGGRGSMCPATFPPWGGAFTDRCRPDVGGVGNWLYFEGRYRGSLRSMPHIVGSWFGEKNIRDRQVLQKQPAYLVIACCRRGSNTLIVLHLHSGEGHRHSNGKLHPAQRFSTVHLVRPD